MGFGNIGLVHPVQTLQRIVKGGINMKINVKHTDKIQAALDSVQQRCRERIMCAEDVNCIVQRAEERLSSILPKKEWRGIRIMAQNGFCGCIPRSYHGAPQSTQVWLERGSSDWFLVSVSRSYSWTTGVRSWCFASDLRDKAEALIRHITGEVY